MPSAARDSVAGLTDDEQPTIVSISDIHGFLSQARSALLTLRDHPEYDPVVEVDAARRLQWAGGNEYVLVFNGDLIDRGPDSERVLEMVARLIEQAPPGHVRVTVGNHEMPLLMPELYAWSQWYSGQRSLDERLTFVDRIFDGQVVAAYEGYTVTYSHAGQPEGVDASEVNEEFVAGTEEFREIFDEADPYEKQEELAAKYQRVFGFDGESGRGPNAGLVWLDFEHIPDDAPPQIVGHTQQTAPVRRGNVICQNVIRKNRIDDGGEAIILETPDSVRAIRRGPDDDVQEHEFSLPAFEQAKQ